MTAMTRSESERQNLPWRRKPSRSAKSDRSNPVGFEGFATLPGSVSNGVLDLEHSRPSPAALYSNRGSYLTQGGSHASGVEQSLTGHGTAQCREVDPQDLKDSLPACLLGDGSEILQPTCSTVYNVHDCVCVSTNNSNVDTLAESEYILDDSLCVLELDPDQALT